MVNTSRILTVSYGTFSCTLEGFDDPFSTMTSIAEYFRDLAADDRYFGAEPPTPDAEMLHRIAEREVQKRVEARVSEHGVVLRQAEDEVKPAVLLADTAARDAQARAARDAAEAEAQAAREAADIAEAEAARKAAEAEAEAARIAAEAAEQARREAAEAEAAQRAQEAAAEDAATEEAPADEPVAGSVTDKLKRIRAVVDGAARTGTVVDFIEDEHADEYFADLSDEYDDVLEDAMTGGDEDETAEEATGDDSAAISAVLGSLIHPAVMEDTTADILAADDEEDAPEAAVDQAIGLWDDDGEDDDGETAADAADDLDDADDDGLFAETDEEAETIEAEAPAEAPAAPARPMARVIKVRRPAPVKAAEPVVESTSDDEDDDEDGFDVPGESTLSEEDEAALAAELAEVERESRDATGDDARAAYGYDEDDEDEAATARDPLAIEPEDMPADRIEAPRRAPLRTAFDDHDISDTDTAVDRILAKTNTQLESGEASRRRSAIQHLKQAVQATRADQDVAGAPDAEDDPQDAYRADLAHVVRPRRPGGGDADGKRTQRRLAPLVLVSEQRIDEPADDAAPRQPATPVRPRRVTKGNLAIAHAINEDEQDDTAVLALGGDEQDGDETGAPMVVGFRAFLEQEQVDGYEDIVEAGVAYVTQEVGRANVTRPQLMTLVRNTMTEMSREDGLRAFGKLLRDGRISKVKRGIFVLSKKSRFYDADA
jgi:hypothetical protein